MIPDFFINWFYALLTVCPVLSLPLGFAEGVHFLVGIVGYINIFVPLVRLAPIVGFIVLVRNWKVVIATLRLILRFIPFMG